MSTISRLKKVSVLIPIAVVAVAAFAIKKSMQHKKYNGTHPGYFAQWFEEKKNENGVIPSGLYGKWAAADRAAAMRRAGENPFDTLWELGPNAYGGRTRAVWIDPNDDNIILAGAISGGMWRSENGGSSWAALDEHQVSMMPSCITHNPFNTSIVY